MESPYTTIKNLAQSCLDDFEEMDIEQQLDFTRDVLKQIQDICDKETRKTASYEDDTWFHPFKD